MNGKRIHALDTSLQTTTTWLKELSILLGRPGDIRCAYFVLRSVLHALRDRLAVPPAVCLGAQLPILLRGVYFEGWNPRGSPIQQRAKDAFLREAASAIRKNYDLDPEQATWAVFELLNAKMSEGETEKIRHLLPKHIRELWPGAFPMFSL